MSCQIYVKCPPGWGFVECDALWVKCFFLLQDEEENGRIEPVGRADTCLEHMGVRSLE